MDIYIKKFLEYKKADSKVELSELSFVENELSNIEYYYDFHDEENESVKNMMLYGFEMITSIDVCNQYRDYLLYKREVLLLNLKDQMSNSQDSFKIFQLEMELNKLTESDSLDFYNYDKDIFKSENAFKLFLEFNKNISNPYIDYSFIFQQMKSDKLIHAINHKKFIKWLIDNNYIKGRLIDEFNIIGGLRSFKKSTSVTRLNIYLNLKERYVVD